jgi:uncharacterized protein (DUF1015 family)
MAKIAPFRALRPADGLADRVASRPYDVLDRTEARSDAAGNPDSFLHITRSEIDLPDSTDPYDPTVYLQARQNLESFISRGSLVRDPVESYYVYQLHMPGSADTSPDRDQTGLICVSSLDDYDSGIIRKHELTRPDKELDRIRHIEATGAQTGNVFLAYPPDPEIRNLLSSWKSTHRPLADFVAGDKIRHAIWALDEPRTVRQITDRFAQDVPHTYIADGHHRAASAAKVRKAGQGGDFFLTTLFPSDELHILDYNRLVKDLNGMTPLEFLNGLESHFYVGKVGKAFSPAQVHEFGLYLAGSWYRLLAKSGAYSEEDLVDQLDVAILQHQVLDQLLSIKDPRTDKRIEFVGGIRGLEFLEGRVNSGEMKLAFSLHPVSIDQLFAIADRGEVMPPKSTWFEPKLRDGLATHLIH